VLAASLVKLAGDSNSRPRATVVLINPPAAATPTTAVPGTATTTPSTATPPAGSSSAAPSTPAQAPTTPLPARARLSAPAKKRLAELEVRLRKSKSPLEQLRLRRLERRVLAGR
jgi:hypothetical protein